MAEKNQEDLLKTTMTFTKFRDQNDSEFPIFSLIRDGRITLINDYFQKLQTEGKLDDIKNLVNSVDSERKTPLQYACYYSYHNLVMYLLMKGAYPFEYSQEGKHPFHICAFMGHQKCIEIIYHHGRHLDRMDLLAGIKQQMSSFKFKKTDIKNGILISPDRHILQVQQRFEAFRQSIFQLFENYLDRQRQNFELAVKHYDTNNRNPIHYASINKFTKCCKTAKYMLNYGLNIEGYDDFEHLFNEVQLLELNKEKRIDPRQYLQAVPLCENFLTTQEYSYLLKRYTNEIKEIRKEVINFPDNDGYTPLHLASFNGDFSQVQYLLKMGGDPKLVDLKHKKQVLDFAESNSVRKYLIDLKDAARKGDQKSMNLLVNCGYDLNEKKTIFGVAPVHTAVEHYSKKKNDEALKYVIKCDADLNISDSNGWTPLHHACKNGDLPVCEKLVENKANINKFSNKGYYPIHIAALYDNHEVIQFLIDNRADIEVQDNGKCTPLILAAKKGNNKSVEVLLNNNARIYATEIRKFTALHYAAFNYHTKTVHLLCRYDADYEKLRNMVNTKGQPAKNLITNTEIQFAFHTLWNASREGNLDIVRKLQMLGEDVNEKTRINQTTPLMFAVQNQHLLIVQFLLENDADPSITDKFGKTAKDYAYDVNNSKIIEQFDHSGIQDYDQQEQQQQ